MPHLITLCGTDRCWKCCLVLHTIARFEAEPIRKAEKFIIKNWWWEPKVEPNDEMREMIVYEIARFTEFLQIDNSLKNTIKLGV